MSLCKEETRTASVTFPFSDCIGLAQWDSNILMSSQSAFGLNVATKPWF